MGITRKTLHNKIDKLEGEIEKTQEHIQTVDKRVIEDTAEKKIIVKDMDRIVDKVFDIASDLNGLVINYKNGKN